MPPAFTEDKYDEWSRRVSFWKALTTVSAEKQGLAIASSLTGKALEAPPEDRLVGSIFR